MVKGGDLYKNGGVCGGVVSGGRWMAGGVKWGVMPLC